MRNRWKWVPHTTGISASLLWLRGGRRTGERRTAYRKARRFVRLNMPDPKYYPDHSPPAMKFERWAPQPKMGVQAASLRAQMNRRTRGRTST